MHSEEVKLRPSEGPPLQGELPHLVVKDLAASELNLFPQVPTGSPWGTLCSFPIPTEVWMLQHPALDKGILQLTGLFEVQLRAGEMPHG